MTEQDTNNQWLNRQVRDYSLRQKSIRKLKKSSITFPSKPDLPSHFLDDEGGLKFPDDITKVEYHELGQLMSVLNNLLAWYGAVLASSRIDRIAAERVKEFIESKVRMEILSDKDMEKRFKAREDKEAFVNDNELVIEAQDWFDEQQSAEIMAEQVYKDYQRAFQTVSREISRRSSEHGNEFREGNLR